MPFSLAGRFKNISIAKKLYFVVGIMALLIAIELFTLWFAISTLSSVRAFVGGEGLWSKGEKDAVYHLQKYGYTHNEADYQSFLMFMKVPLGDHKTRIELLKKNPHMDAAREGFLEGRNNPKDIDGMINLFTRFHNISYIHNAIIIWSQADSTITPLIPLGEALHREITSANPSKQTIDESLEQLKVINDKLTVLEDDFSYTLGEGSRWLERVILRLLLAVALTVELSGLILTISVSRGIQRGLKEIIRVSKAIAGGNFKAKARAYSGDEIGLLANSFNQMADDLGKTTEALKQYTYQLEQSNDSLAQFAYIASHDLKEPLRKINLFASRLEDDYETAIDETGKTYLAKITNAASRLQRLIDDILNYSRINVVKLEVEKTDLNKVLNQVLSDLEPVIEKEHAKINKIALPVINANAIQMNQLFQNLISNSLKFKKADTNVVIDITAEEVNGSSLPLEYKVNNSTDEKLYKITVKDNGIGFESVYAERIFEVFQRLNDSTKYAGTGIGLAICKKIVENHHGKLIAEGVPEKGATFIILLPVSQQSFQKDLKKGTW